MKWNITVNKHTSKITLTIQMSLLKLKNWVIISILSYFWGNFCIDLPHWTLTPYPFSNSLPLRRRLMEFCWDFGSDTGSCCMTVSAVTLFIPSTVCQPGLSSLVRNNYNLHNNKLYYFTSHSVGSLNTYIMQFNVLIWNNRQYVVFILNVQCEIIISIIIIIQQCCIEKQVQFSVVALRQ